MSILDFFHGSALSRIVGNSAVSLEKYKNNNSSFVINNEIAIYIKYSQQRIKPWSFSFLNSHVDELKAMKKIFNKLFIVLICNEDGICCLDYDEFSAVISVENIIFPKWIKVTRSKGEKYLVTGSDGKLSHKIGNIDFPNKLFLKQ